MRRLNGLIIQELETVILYIYINYICTNFRSFLEILNDDGNF